MEYTQRFRRHVAPYDTFCSIRVVSGTNYCPAVQSISASGSPDIDRTSVPTIIAADVVATTKDNSGTIDSILNSSVTNIKWYVQKGSESVGKDITTHSEWSSSDYSFGSGADKGRLTVSKNIPAGTSWRIWFECDINDTRLGYTVAVHVVSDAVLLFSIADAGEQYIMSIDRPSAEIYEPALDARLLHDWKTGNGIASTFVDDGKTYLRKMNVALKKGKDVLSASDYTIKIFKVSGSNRTEVTTSTERSIEAISGNEITFNLLFSEEITFQISCFVGTNEVARKNYGWAWSSEFPTTDEGIVGGATYCDGEQQSYRPKFNFAGSVLECPCVAFCLDWYYRKNSALTYVGNGEVQTYDLTDGNMFVSGSTEGEAVLQISKRGAFAYVADGSDRLVDDSGNYYIEN